MVAYYNEIDPFAAAWLRELIKAGLIAAGEVDERSIAEVRPSDLVGFRQCHFFAGIGVWSYALRSSGWSDDREVWTGSCPCQGFSDAGARAGFADERHLWPVWRALIAECRPVALFGEQVASKDGLAWLDLVHADLEAEAYRVGAVDLCAAGFGAPHIRQRLFFVADARCERRQQERGSASCDEEAHGRARRNGGEPNGDHVACCTGQIGVMGNASCAERWSFNGTHREGRRDTLSPGQESAGGLERAGEAGGVGVPPGGRQQRFRGEPAHSEPVQAEPVNGFWRNAEWLPCIDGKARPVEPGTFPLAHGAPARVGRLRGYGNAINAQVAQAFIESYMSL